MRARSSESSGRTSRQGRQAPKKQTSRFVPSCYTSCNPLCSVFGDADVEADKALARALKMAGMDRAANVSVPQMVRTDDHSPPLSARCQGARPRTPQIVQQETDAAWDKVKATPRGTRPEQSEVRAPPLHLCAHF